MRLTISNIFVILKAKFSKKDDLGSWYNKRLILCHMCTRNSKNIPLRKYTLRMWKWYIFNLFKPFCSICGCQITAKASVEVEECALEEVGEEPKWTSIL